MYTYTLLNLCRVGAHFKGHVQKNGWMVYKNTSRTDGFPLPYHAMNAARIFCVLYQHACMRGIRAQNLRGYSGQNYILLNKGGTVMQKKGGPSRISSCAMCDVRACVCLCFPLFCPFGMCEDTICKNTWNRQMVWEGWLSGWGCSMLGWFKVYTFRKARWALGTKK